MSIFRRKRLEIRNAQRAEVLWSLPAMGYNGQLLYWEAILSLYTKKVMGCKILCSTSINASHLKVLPLIPLIRSWQILIPRLSIGAYSFGIRLPSPTVILAILKARPLVLVLSEFGLMSVYGIIASRLLRGCRILLLVEGDPGQAGTGILGWRIPLRRFIANRAHTVLTNNTRGRRYLEHSLGLECSRIRQSPYLVSSIASTVSSTRRHPAVSGGSDDDQVTFLSVGRLEKRKGIDLLLNAFAALPERTRSQCKVWLVGDGPERTSLEELRRTLGIENQVYFFGQAPYSEIPEYFRAADVFVLPTRGDYRALVGFEALSMGKPVLISKFDGAAEEVVRPCENGMVFDPLDTREFTRLLDWFARNREQLSLFGAESRRIADNFTFERAADTLASATWHCLGIVTVGHDASSVKSSPRSLT